MSTTPNDMQALRSQLEEKNELVQALTSQLEKTVNQLDRLRRSGADRVVPGASSGGSMPEIVGRLTGALDEWDEVQPGERIVRIEEGVAKILEMLASGEYSASANNSSHASAAPRNDFWEQAKARILGDEPEASIEPVELSEPESVDAATVEPLDEPAAEEAQFEEEPAEAPIADEPMPDPPLAVGPDANADELWKAIDSRDQYIIYLTSRLRSLEARKIPPVDWDKLNSAPQETAIYLQSLESTLREQLKQAEIGLAIERAGLARERAKLMQIKESLDARIRRMGGAAPTSPEEETRTAQEDQERRWKRIFSR